jgi:hypothetical protein
LQHGSIIFNYNICSLISRDSENTNLIHLPFLQDILERACRPTWYCAMYVIVLKKKLKSGGQQSNCFGMNNGLISAIRNTFSSMSTMSVLIMPFFFCPRSKCPTI